MKAILFALFIVTGAAANARTAGFTPAQASQRIAKAVKSFEPLAGSGVEVFRVRPASTVKAMLLELALKEGYADSEEDFSWVGSDGSAWDADSTNSGEETMSGAYSYIMTRLDDEDVELTPQQKVKLQRDLAKAKAGFELLLHTGVKFGVVPLGATQCGVRFGGLAVIDPHTGKIYVVAREGSGC